MKYFKIVSEQLKLPFDDERIKDEPKKIKVHFRKDWKKLGSLPWVEFYRRKVEGKRPSRKHLEKLITTFIISAQGPLYIKKDLKHLQTKQLQTMWNKIKKPYSFLTKDSY